MTSRKKHPRDGNQLAKTWKCCAIKLTHYRINCRLAKPQIMWLPS